MNVENQVKINLDKIITNIATGGFNEESVDMDRNKIKGYKDFL